MNIRDLDIPVILKCPKLLGFEKSLVKPNLTWDVLSFCLSKTIETGHVTDWRAATRHILQVHKGILPKNAKEIKEFYAPFKSIYEVYRSLAESELVLVGIQFPYDLEIVNGIYVNGIIPAIFTSDKNAVALINTDQDHYHSWEVRLGAFVVHQLTNAPIQILAHTNGTVKKVYPDQEYIAHNKKIVQSVVQAVGSLTREGYNPNSCFTCSYLRKCHL